MQVTTKPSIRVLIVEDDVDAAEMLAELIRTPAREVVVAHTAADALRCIEANRDVSLVLTDVQMPGMDGIDLCQKLREILPGTQVIVLTGDRRVETVIRALRAGALDIHIRPLDVDLLAQAIDRALEQTELRCEDRRVCTDVNPTAPSHLLAGTSAPMREVMDIIARVAPTDATVLIHGESGTGKELVARAIHETGTRPLGPFVAINCAAVPAPLLESELFGHVRGAFTDAHQAHDGLLIAASGGTLFLDEIGEMPIGMQSRLLRALQQRTVRPVGGQTEVPFDARLITATHRDLESDVRAKRFREDLHYRIAVVILEVPTLRERVQDIPSLVQLFVRRFATRFGKRVLGVAPAALAMLLAYAWPGNVRELENCIERAVALTQCELLSVDDLPARVRDHVSIRVPVLPQQAEDLVTLAELDRKYIHQVMSLVGGNKSRAARILGLDRRTLYRIFERERPIPPSVPGELGN